MERTSSLSSESDSGSGDSRAKRQHRHHQQKQQSGERQTHLQLHSTTSSGQHPIHLPTPSSPSSLPIGYRQHIPEAPSLLHSEEHQRLPARPTLGESGRIYQPVVTTLPTSLQHAQTFHPSTSQIYSPSATMVRGSTHRSVEQRQSSSERGAKGTATPQRIPEGGPKGRGSPGHLQQDQASNYMKNSRKRSRLSISSPSEDSASPEHIGHVKDLGSEADQDGPAYAADLPVLTSIKPTRKHLTTPGARTAPASQSSSTGVRHSQVMEKRLELPSPAVPEGPELTGPTSSGYAPYYPTGGSSAERFHQGHFPADKRRPSKTMYRERSSRASPGLTTASRQLPQQQHQQQ
eukprot:scpid85987/ scgid23795/ 